MASAEPVWVNQPGDYSGDTWHIGGAMVVDPRIRVFQTVSECEHARTRSVQAAAFYSAIGFGDRVDAVSTRDLTEGLRLRCASERVIYNRRNVACASDNLRQQGLTPRVLFVYQATSVILANVAATSREATVALLTEAFAADFPKCLPDAAAQITDTVQSLPDRALVVIGRYAKYHHGYNASREVLDTCTRVAAEVGRKLVLFADRNNKLARAALGDLHITCVDPYDVHSSANRIAGTPHIDMRATAYFWQMLRSHGGDCLVIGGRSGSTDIAAYMGMRVVEWDTFNPHDPESLRLSRMAPGLCSTLHIDRNEGWRSSSDHFVRLSNGRTEVCRIKPIELLTGLCTREFRDVWVKHESGCEELVLLPGWWQKAPQRAT